MPRVKHPAWGALLQHRPSATLLSFIQHAGPQFPLYFSRVNLCPPRCMPRAAVSHGSPSSNGLHKSHPAGPVSSAGFTPT